MDLKNKLYEYRGHIVITGILIGGLSRLKLLPETLSMLGEYTNYLYLGIIILAGYLYWQYQWPKYSRGAPTYQKTVPSRNLSSPSHVRDLKRQRGYVEKKSTPVPEGRSSSMKKPSDDVFKSFHKDE